MFSPLQLDPLPELPPLWFLFLLRLDFHDLHNFGDWLFNNDGPDWRCDRSARGRSKGRG